MCHVFPVEKMVTFAPFGVADLLQVAEVCKLIFLASIYLYSIAYLCSKFSYVCSKILLSLLSLLTLQ
jgi:hypothetical protein